MNGDANSAEALQLVDATTLRLLTAQAVAAPRKRSHLLLHAGPQDQAQRLIIAAEPGTYIRPHRHSLQWEMLAVLRGCLDILIFDRDGVVIERSALDQTSPVAQIAVAHWHTCFVREPGTVIVEIKPGPYRANEFADWAPEGEQERAGDFLGWIASAAVGQKWQPL
jgi:cupin fold WbuC family metalloprotein